MNKTALLCATTALVLPASAFAQSTGTLEIEDAIVVTGARTTQGVEGIVVPDTGKAQQVITEQLIERQAPGQTILNVINLVPGVNFTQNDAFGSSGGNIRIRGFDGNRISLTFDGLPLNDTGNYAIYSNQQLDPELIEQVNVNMGQTDVDSPTASAAGGTVNYRTRLPSREMGARLALSGGSFNFARGFAMFDTGEIGPWGTRAFVAGSIAQNDKFRGPGEIDKRQFNARIYQPLGGNDFISVSAHYNRNRNNFYRNPGIGDLRTLGAGAGFTVPANPAITPANPLVLGDFTDPQWRAIYDFENDRFCQRPALPGGPGAQRETTTPTGTTPICTSFFGVRINPSDTGNIRAQSRFTLADGLILTIDPSFQYTLANGGGISTLAENSAIARGASNAPGVDFNGDGDFLDTIQFYTPNNTNTRRWGLTSSLIWNFAPQHRVRIAYTFDRGRHRQTGEWGYMGPGGFPENPFGGRNGRPVLAADGFQLQQRDRLSIALLNQISGQYIGRFFEDRLRVEAGVRAPFFKRELNNFCFTQTGGSGFATCTSQPGGPGQIVAPNAPGPIPSGRFFAPFEAEYEFNAVLPNLGLTYYLTENINMFASYARGFSAPRTDNLYRAPRVNIEPETTDAFDAGVRYNSRWVQAQAVGWYIGYRNRIITSFDQELGISVDRNVGKVKSYGFDGSIAVQPTRAVTLYALASYISARFQEDVVVGAIAGVPTTSPTRGKFVPETPEWQFGGRAQVELGPVELGLQGKWVDDRFATDLNDVVVKSYALFDLDARVGLAGLGLDRSYFQFNVHNLFDKKYFGNISTRIDVGGNPNFTPGAPRTFIGTFNLAF
ncbi:MAG: TonB-dependent receptor [Allosphingosinicella sp.]|uniref:TonB-dependent receptor n=1 Tax=Allosphingosinicella sp. TaxID=2823234 RepID=UPI003923080B